MTKPDPYRCRVCGHEWPVRILARDCEDRHETDMTIEPDRRETPPWPELRSQ